MFLGNSSYFKAFLKDQRQNSKDLLTVHVHSDGFDGRGAQAILSLAVVAASLVSLDVGNPQGFVEDTGILESV